jgi:hypothetical protein|tara:strand:+ start:227 stop:364 length:138 start_codon:yes stop_codon:yes gene_type:complete
MVLLLRIASDTLLPAEAEAAKELHDGLLPEIVSQTLPLLSQRVDE